MIRPFFLLLLSIVTALLCGCGYSLSAGGSSLIKERSVTVSMFANRTYQPGIEGKLRAAMVAELASRGVPIGTGETDLVIGGEIESLAIDTTAFSAADKAMLYRVAMTVQMKLVENKGGQTIWKTSETLMQEYPSSADLSLQRNARDAALSSLCERIARTVVNKMNQTF